MDIEVRPGDALIVIDPQIDFCPGGALAVAGGDEIMADIAALANRFPLVVIHAVTGMCVYKSEVLNDE